MCRQRNCMFTTRAIWPWKNTIPILRKTLNLFWERKKIKLKNHETFNSQSSQPPRKWIVYILPGGRAERCTGSIIAAWLSDLIAHVQESHSDFECEISRYCT